MLGISPQTAQRAVEAAANVDPSDYSQVARALLSALSELDLSGALARHARQVSRQQDGKHLADHTSVTAALDQLDPKDAKGHLMDNSTIAGVILRGNEFVAHAYETADEKAVELRLAGNVVEGLLRPGDSPPMDLTELAHSECEALTPEVIARQWQLEGWTPGPEQGRAIGSTRFYIGAGYAQRPHLHVDPVFLAYAFGPSIVAGEASLSSSDFIDRVEDWIEHCYDSAVQDRGPGAIRAAVRHMAKQGERNTFLSDSKFIASKAWTKVCAGIESREGSKGISMSQAARFLCGEFFAPDADPKK